MDKNIFNNLLTKVDGLQTRLKAYNSFKIKHCSTSKTYRKGLEKGLIMPNEFKTIINKEEKKDENN